MQDAKKLLLIRLLLLTLIIVAVYGNSLHNGFVWDDVQLIVDNATLKLANISKFFLSEDLVDTPTGYYRPITYISFALDRAIWGLNPVGFNITNVALHLLVALLFFRVVSRLFSNEKLGFLAALLFALHPIAGETVNFHAGGRNTLLCASFALLSLLCYLDKRRALSVAAFALAIFSKEFALLMPAVFFLYDRTVRKEKVAWTSYLPYVVAGAGYLTLRSVAVAHGNLLKSLDLANYKLAPFTVASYFQTLVWPLNVKTMYQVEPAIGLAPFLVSTAVVVLLAAAVFFFRKQQEILFGAVIFFLFLLPVLNILPLGSALLADRYAYFASFGFCIVLAYAINRLPKKSAAAVLGVLCALYVTVDVQRNGIWKDEISFFTQMSKDAPDKSIGFQNLGYAYYNKHDYPNAERNLRIASSKKDVNPTMLVGHAEMFWEMQKHDLAIAALQKKLQLEPNNPQSLIMLSTIYEDKGDLVAAKEYRDKALAIFPGIQEIMKKRATSACRQGEARLAQQKMVLAERLFREALKIDPRFTPALIDLGILYSEKGELDKALQYFSKAAAAEPSNASAHYNLSLAYEALGRKAEAAQAMAKHRALVASKETPHAQQ